MAEVNANVTPGSGLGVDSFNVGAGAIGSGTEAIRQAIAVASPTVQANVAEVDAAGRLQVAAAHVATAAVTASWTSATAVDTTLAMATTGYGSVLVTLNPTTTFTGGTLNFEASDDGGANWYAVSAQRTDTQVVEATSVIVANTKRAWMVPVGVWTNFRVRVNPVIAGTGTAVVRIQAVSGSATATVMANIMAVGTAPTGTSVPVLLTGQSTAAALATDAAPAVRLHPAIPTTGNVRAQKDSGRSAINLSWEEMAGTAAAESALTNFTSGSKAAAAVTAATNYTVTAAKTLRITSINVYLKSTGTTLLLARYRLRQAASAIANTSPIIWDFILGTELTTTASGVVDFETITIPDGLEVAAGQQVTFTWFTSASGCTVGLTLTGFEY